MWGHYSRNGGKIYGSRWPTVSALNLLRNRLLLLDLLSILRIDAVVILG